MFSIVCTYNNKKILEKFLIKSLKTQNMTYKLFLLDNTQQKYKSASEALNVGADKAVGDYLLFIHQDVDLLSENWLEDAHRIIEKIDDIGIVGVAGKSENESGIITNIKHGVPPVSGGNIKIKDVKKVQTLDECVMIIPKSVFQKVQFDETTCDDWHLYGIEYCLSVKLMGKEVYVLPLSLYHRSYGSSMSKRYMSTLKKVINKHKNNYKIICTPMMNWRTSYPFFIQKYLLILNLLFVGMKSWMGKIIGRNKVGVKPYLETLKGLYR